MILRDEIIRKAREVHGDLYDYSLVTDSQNVLSKIKIICRIHGVFEQTIHNHLQGKGCRLCYINRGCKTRPTKQQVIEYARKTHDDIDNYDFSTLPEQLNLHNYDSLIELICKKHGRFKIHYNKFIEGEQCPYCSGKLKTDEEINKELSILHPELDFSITKFSEHDDKYNILAICPKHGKVKVKYYNLIYGQGGCVQCGWDKIKEKETPDKKEFEYKVYEVHGDKYDPSEAVYVNARTKLKMICPEHGEFWVTPTNLLSRKSGCPVCNNNHLEDEICRFLRDNKINIIPQMHFEWLGKQSIDFYLPDYNIGIECQGIQHFIPRAFTNDTGDLENKFRYLLNNDIKKFNLCEGNIKLIYFTYLNNFKEEYYNNEKYGFIYNKDNVFFDKEKMLNEIRG